MRGRAISYLLAAGLVAACDKVTAPRALQIADDMEQSLWRSWDPTSLGGFPIQDGYDNIWQNDSSTILFSVDGGVEPLDVAVIERVFIPSRGQGAPISRRSLVAWPRNGSYGILASTETNADEHGAVADYKRETDLLNPRPRLVVPRPRQGDWWIPRSAMVSIEPQDTGAPCPFSKGGADAERDGSGRVTCNLATYDVRLEGELVRQLDAENGLLPETMKQHHRVALGTQRVKGIRFTVSCHPTKLILMTAIYNGCTDSPFVFWRSNALFAPSLGVDVGRMQLVSQLRPLVYGRTLRAGSPKRPDGSRLIRWTVSYPDGTVLERDSTIDNRAMPADRSWLEQCANGMGYGGKRQCLIDEMSHPTMRSRYGVLVVDMEDAAR